MLDVGLTELLCFAVIALLVLGPEKLPQAVRTVGLWYGKFKRLVNNVQQDIERELRLSEFREQMQQEMLKIQELEQKMQQQIHQLQHQYQQSAALTEPMAVKIKSALYVHYHHQIKGVYSTEFFKTQSKIMPFTMHKKDCAEQLNSVHQDALIIKDFNLNQTIKPKQPHHESMSSEDTFSPLKVAV